MYAVNKASACSSAEQLWKGLYLCLPEKKKKLSTPHSKNLFYDLHDSSEIIARTQNLFVYISPRGKRQLFFNASHISHVYSIELIFDVDYRS